MIQPCPKIMLIYFIVIFSGLSWLTLPSAAQSDTSIVALVNDEPITNHDINMRVKLSLANSTDVRKRLKKKLSSPRTQKLWKKMIDEYQPQSKAEAKNLQVKLVKKLRSEVRASLKRNLKKKILKELVDERIQLQQANKLGVALTEQDLDAQLERIASGNKNRKTGKPLTRQEFTKTLTKMGVPIEDFRTRMKARVSWTRVVRQKFKFQIKIGNRDVDRLIDSQSSEKKQLKTVFKIQRIRVAVSTQASEPKKAEKLIEADRLRQVVTSCSQLEKAVKRISGATLKSLGTKPADSFPHTMRTFLTHTKDGHLTPPTLTSSGVELYAVCGRKQRRVADKSKRLAVKEKLRQQEFEVLARRHLQDLRQEASVEYR